MINIYSIKDSDETTREFLKVAKKLREHGKCIVAHEIVMQAVAARILKKGTPPRTLRRAEEWNNWVNQKEMQR